MSHALNLTVEKAGIYALDLAVPPGFVVSEVKGEGVDDWKATDGKLKISFASRVLGARKLDIQLEQANKEFPDKITVLPLAVAGATNVTTQLGAASSPGIRLKTAELTGLREVPITSLPNRSDELLAFASEQPDWKLTLAAEKLAPRVIAEVFNLVTVGDGVVGRQRDDPLRHLQPGRAGIPHRRAGRIGRTWSSPARTSGARNSRPTCGPSPCRTRRGAATRWC